MDIEALKTEITTDPAGLGYAGKTDKQVADLLNAPQRTRQADTLSTALLIAAVDKTEYAALSAADKQYLQFVCTTPELPMIQPLKGQLGALFPAGSNTRTRLVALQQQTTTRAAELGLGVVGDGHVASARAA